MLTVKYSGGKTIAVKGKLACKPFPKASESRTMATLDLIHTDVCGPMRTITPDNKRYILTIIDDYSRYFSDLFDAA